MRQILPINNLCFMKNVIFIIILFTAIFVGNGFGQKRESALAQDVNKLRKQIESVKAENEKLRQNLASVQEKVNNQNEQLQKLQNALGKANENLNQKADSISEKIEDNNDSANQKISDLETSLSRNTLIWLAVSVVAAIILIALFWRLSRKQQSEKADLETAINATRKSLEEESVRLDNKLAEILALQLNNVNRKPQEKEIDHSLVLKVANEMNRMRMNIINMNPETRGLKQLNRALNNMMDSLQGKGYEIVDLLGKSYEKEMNLLASMEPDEKLDVGEERIRRIIKPHINFEGKTIQSGEVVVGYGE